MAGHLAAKGHEVTVYNRTAAKAEAWVAEHKGRTARTPREAAEGAEFVFACVGNDDDLRSVCTGEDGAFAGLGRGAVFVDHTTASAAVARELYAAADAAQVSFVDAPVSGGQAGAENGALIVMCGGDDERLRARRAGDHGLRQALPADWATAGAGQLTKMVNQICIAGLVQGLSEGLAFAEKAGPRRRGGARGDHQGRRAGSWQMENRGKTMLDDKFDFGFAVDWMRKDLGICLAEANANGASLPVTALVDQFYKDVQEMGGGRWDTSSLFKRLARAWDEGEGTEGPRRPFRANSPPGYLWSMEASLTRATAAPPRARGT